MSEHQPLDSCRDSTFSEESDPLASDIEADLQELSIGTEEDGFTHSPPSLTGSSLSSLPLHTLPDGQSATAPHGNYANYYLRAASLKGIHAGLTNAQLKENCGSPTCIVILQFRFELSFTWTALFKLHCFEVF